jgi:membrane protein DedA with SNARE-associated domain
VGGGPALALATGGYLLGAGVAYWGGKRGGERVLERIGKLGGWDQAKGDRLSALFRRWGPLMGALGRFIPPARAASLWAAGALRVDPLRYFPALVGSTLLYNGFWLTAGLSLAPYLHLLVRGVGPVALILFLTLAFFRWVRTRQRRGDLW